MISLFDCKVTKWILLSALEEGFWEIFKFSFTAF